MIYRAWIKPFFDSLFAGILLIVALPLIMPLIIVLAIHFKGTPFFSQKRSGFKEKPFLLVKFKTMRNSFDSSGSLLPDSVRLTKLGKWVRRTSLDELPQLWNVFIGNMSFVGPRPLLIEYLPLYNEEQKRRHLVKPGISGWAQVNGRNALDWQTKFKLDVWYVDHQSFWLDFRIIGLTVFKVFIAEGISGANSVTMEKFKGVQES